MTYCVAMNLREGMVFVSDSRTNAGVDQIATFRKTQLFQAHNDAAGRQGGKRIIVMLSAGNLATTQSVISLLRARSQHEGIHLMNAPSMYEVAEIVGKTIREVVARDSGPQAQSIDFGCTMIVGGQLAGEAPRLFSIYPQGNFIESTAETPFFQIGESKYGKPIIDRVLEYSTPLPLAAQCALISVDSTMKSNLSVGLPLDVTIYKRDSFAPEQHRIDEKDPYFRSLSQAWSEGLRRVFSELPPPQL